MTGGFSPGPFRTGAAGSSTLEAIFKALNAAKGTAFNVEPGTVVWVENMARARVLTDAWETSRRFALQFDPSKLTAYIERWEKILGIVPTDQDTNVSRRRTIAAKLRAFNVAPLGQLTQDLLKGIMGDMFLSLMHIPSTHASGSLPGGADLPGGVSLPDGEWSSTIAHLPIRVHQPQGMTDAEFHATVNKFKPVLSDFLPAWVTFAWGRFSPAIGTITVAAGSTSVTGNATEFLTGASGAVTPGMTIEVYDDDGELQNLTVSSVADDTNLTIQSPIATDITEQPWRRMGFFLDISQLDNAFFNA